eukprot:scaffold269890_cov33-Attheya_sp.AAC.1
MFPSSFVRHGNTPPADIGSMQCSNGSLGCRYCIWPSRPTTGSLFSLSVQIGIVDGKFLPGKLLSIRSIRAKCSS